MITQGIDPFFKNLIMKKTVLFLTAIILGIPVMSFAQESEIIQENELYLISDSSGIDANWNFANIDLDDFPNTLDSDLVQLLNPKTVYDAQTSWLLNTPIIGELPTKSFTEDDMTLQLVGNYQATLEGSGSLNIPNDTFLLVDKVKYTETYFLLFEGDTLANYTNIYFSFFNATTKHKVFETFKKVRSLSGNTNWVFYGVSSCVSCFNSGNPPDIELLITPNPSSANSVVTYNLWNNANVSISITNQLSTVNDVLFSGLNSEGSNSITVPVQNYATGLYNINVMVNNVSYSVPLIIQ